MGAVDLAGLDEDGYVVLKGVLDDALVARLREAFVAAPGRDGTQHVEIGEGTPHAASWLALTRHPAVLDAAERLLPGGATFHVHGRNPLPGYGQQGLHADSRPRRPGEPVLAVTAIWMLDPFTADNGATRVVPGTHRLRHAVPRRYAQPHAHHPDEVVVTGDAGAVLVFNGHLWHSGRRNTSRGPRRAVQMTAQAGGIPLGAGA